MIAICPSRAALESWLGGAGPDNDLAKHVANCADCRTILDQLSDDPELRQMAHALTPSNTDEPGQTVPRTSSVERARPERIGPYRLEAELGRGGMGVVYRAVDDVLHRTVALKLIRRETVRDQDRERMLREARSAARVQHENIVGVYAAGIADDGAPYLAMEYVAGPTLAEVIKNEKRLKPRDAATFAAQIADGLAAAHAVGLVHRDVKPSNVLVVSNDGTNSLTTVKLADFGLVRDDRAASVLTMEGTIAGTPAYLSPEQARGAATDIRSDVYGLGVTLYESLVGEVPFRGPAIDVLRQVLDDEPKPPRQLDATIPADLETIALKALAKEPIRRYQKADEFAADLRRWLHNEPIHARPAGRVERTWRWCRRNPRMATLTGLVAALLVTLAVGGTTAAVLISRAYDRAKVDREKAVVSQQQAEADFDVALKSMYTLAETVQSQMGAQPGLLPIKRKLLETAADGLKKVVHGPTGAERAAQTVVIAHTSLGDVYRELGRAADARREFETGLNRGMEWLSNKPDDIDALRGVASANDRLGDFANEDMSGAKALRYYVQAHNHRKRAAEINPNNLVLLRDLSVSHNKIGDGEDLAGNVKAARSHYEDALKIAEQLATNDTSILRLADLRFTNNRLTDICLKTGDLDTAERHALAAVENGRAIAKLDSVSGRFQTANALDRLGGVMLRRFQPDAAVKHRSEGVELRREITTADKGSFASKIQLSTAISQYADALFSAGDFEQAFNNYAEALRILSELFAIDPESVTIAFNLKIAYNRIIKVYNRLGRYSELADWLNKAAEFYRRIEGKPRFERLDPTASIETANTFLAATRFVSTHDVLDLSQHASETEEVRAVLKRVRVFELARHGRADDVLLAVKELNTSDDSFEALTAARACAIVGRPEAAIGFWMQAVRLEPGLAIELATFHEFHAYKDRPEFQALIAQPTKSDAKK